MLSTGRADDVAQMPTHAGASAIMPLPSKQYHVGFLGQSLKRMEIVGQLAICTRLLGCIIDSLAADPDSVCEGTLARAASRSS